MKTCVLWIHLFCLPLALVAQGEWRAPEKVVSGVVTAHADMVSFADTAASRTFVMLKEDENSSPFYRSLNGRWQFKYCRLSEVPKDFFKAKTAPLDWEEIEVPGCWALQGLGLSPAFAEVPMAFTGSNAQVSDDQNAAGLYVQTFNIPDEWSKKPVFLGFDGVKSAFTVWINGQKVGYSELEATQFDISPYIDKGTNTLAVQVLQWSDMSFLDNRSGWQLRGIYGDVYLQVRPPVYLRDYAVVTDFDDEYRHAELRINAYLHNVTDRRQKQHQLRWTLLDAKGNLMATETVRTASELAAGSEAVLNIAKIITSPQKWTAENPNLYLLHIELLDVRGQVLEVVSNRIGFREVQIHEGQLMINGKPLIVKGVNYQPFDPVQGWVIPAQTMLRDIKLMKQHNINAVRVTRTMPLRFFQLCDEIGLYVLADAEITTGSLHAGLSNQAEWGDAFGRRVVNMVERAQNHACVYGWGIGANAGFGRNIPAIVTAVRQIDPFRPLQYETAESGASGTEGFGAPSALDIIANRYLTPEMIVNLHENQVSRPIVLTEYAPNCGNSMGELTEYWKIVQRCFRMQGGFVWTWTDFTLRDRQPGQKPTYRYHAEGVPHEVAGQNLCGLTTVERQPKAALAEVKRAYQAVEFREVDLKAGRIIVQNLSHFENLSEYQLNWALRSEGRVLDKGTFTDFELLPETSVELKVPFRKPANDSTAEFFLEFSLQMKQRTVWADKGYEIAFEQFKIPYREELPILVTRQMPPVNAYVREEENQILVESENLNLIFDRARGQLFSWIYNNEQVLGEEEPLTLSFWRLPTPNDKTSHLYQRWLEAGLDSTYMEVIKCDAQKVGNAVVRVMNNARVMNRFGRQIFEAFFVYDIYGSGDILLDTYLMPMADLPPLPRVGWDMKISEEFGRLRWFGNGKHETYPDRRLGGKIDFYSGGLTEPYLMPQHCANMTDMRWFSLTNLAGTGIALQSNQYFYASAYKYSKEEAATARYFSQVPDNGYITACMDFDVAGVGMGYIPSRHQVQPKYMAFSFRLRPLVRDDESEFDIFRSYLPEIPLMFLQPPRIRYDEKVLNKPTSVRFVSTDKNTVLRYTTDGSEPTEASTVYSGALTLSRSTDLKIKAFKREYAPSLTTHRYLHFTPVTAVRHLSSFTNLSDLDLFAPFNGQFGDLQQLTHELLAYQGKDMDVVLTLHEAKDLSEVVCHFWRDQHYWAFPPKELEVYVSADGQDFVPAGSIKTDLAGQQVKDGRYELRVPLSQKGVRYLRLIARNQGQVPDWHKCAREVAWMLADEIEIK